MFQEFSMKLVVLSDLSDDLYTVPVDSLTK